MSSTQKIRIAYVCSQPVIGGLPWLMAYTAKNLIDRFDFEIEFFYMSFYISQSSCKNHNILEYLDQNRIKYQIFGNDDYSGFFSWLNGKLNNFDVVHYGCIYWFDRNVLEGRRNFIFNSGKGDQTISFLYENNLLDSIDKIVCVSQELHESESPEVQSKSIVIENAVDPSLFLKANRQKMRRLLGFEENDRVVIWNGRLFDRIKRSDILLKVIDNLKNSEIKFLILSPYTGMTDAAKNNFDKLDQDNENVSILWNVKPWEIQDYMICGDVYLHTSDAEGMSLATIEATLCDLQIVSRNAIGQKELTGNIFNSVDEITSEILSNKKSEQKFENNFDEYINKYKNLYKFKLIKTSDRLSDRDFNSKYMINNFDNDQIFVELNKQMNFFKEYKNTLFIEPFCLMREEEIKILYSLSKYCSEMFKDKYHLEIGSFCGGSMCYICNSPEHKCISIDTFFIKNMKASLEKNHHSYNYINENYRKYYDFSLDESKNLYEQIDFCKYIWTKNRIIDQIKIYQSKSCDATEYIENNSCSFIYIDAHHSYDAVFSDLVNYFDKCISGGYIVLHDYSLYSNYRPTEGVDLAIYDFVYKYLDKIDNLFMSEKADNLAFIRKK